MLYGPLSDQIRSLSNFTQSVVLKYSFVNGDRIELAVGTPPYPGLVLVHLEGVLSFPTFGLEAKSLKNDTIQYWNPESIQTNKQRCNQ